MFVDNLGKAIDADSAQDIEDLLHWMDTFGEKNNIKFTVTLSADPETISEDLRRFL